MALLEKQLVIKRSTIPNAGKGLFTKKFIAKGTIIIEYKGRVTSWKDADHDNGNNNYLYYLKRYHVIDSRPYKKALARYCNDANGLTKVKGIRNNAVYVNVGLRVFKEAIKDIPAGTEILVDYGKKYWDKMRERIQLEKKAEDALLRQRK